MDLQPWDPWREFEGVQSEIDRILERFLGKVRQVAAGKEISFFPATDVIETADDIRLFLSLPGTVEEDIELSVEEGLLVIRGEREAPYDPEQARGHKAEWRYGRFERRFRLPYEFDPESLTATYRWGVLTVVIPKKVT